MPDPKYFLNSKSQFADDTAIWYEIKKVTHAAHRIQGDMDALAELCTKLRIKLNL